MTVRGLLTPAAGKLGPKVESAAWPKASTVDVTYQTPSGLPQAQSSLGSSSRGRPVLSTSWAVTPSPSGVSARVGLGGSAGHGFAKGTCKMSGQSVICICHDHSVLQRG